MVTASLPGFRDQQQDIEVTANAIVPIALKLTVASVSESIEVTAETINPESSKTETLTHRLDIERQPDADRSGSLSMITNNVPGTYVMHDHLHARGGHGVTFEIDGRAGAQQQPGDRRLQFDPKDVDYLESERGRSGGQLRRPRVWRIQPRPAQRFEANKFGDATARYGNYNQASLYSASATTRRIRSSRGLRAFRQPHRSRPRARGHSRDPRQVNGVLRLYVDSLQSVDNESVSPSGLRPRGQISGAQHTPSGSARHPR
jgi:hypothetical protein